MANSRSLYPSPLPQRRPSRVTATEPQMMASSPGMSARATSSDQRTPRAKLAAASILSGGIRRGSSFLKPPRNLGVGTKTVMPRRSALARSGRCGESGLTLLAVALFHGSMSRSRAAAISAPAKFGIRPCGGNGKRATPSAVSVSHTHCRAALLSAKSRAMTESGAARPGDRVVPVYDLKIKGGLVGGNPRPLVLDSGRITPLRGFVDDSHGSRLFEPRTTVRTKLHFGALRSLRPSGVAHALAPGVGAGIRTFRKPDGTSGREYLDVGENPPNGAIINYWLDEGVAGPVSLALYDEGGAAIASFHSDDNSLPAAKRPSVRSGLNRFVWDLKYPGPQTLDISLAPPRNKPLAAWADPPAGPTVVPGRYRVELSLGSETMTAEFSVVKDPRLSMTAEGYRQQFELLRELTASLGKVTATVNRIRRLKHRLSALAGGSERGEHDLTAEAQAVAAKTAVEAVLVDIHRESERDVLRNPARLSDTLLTLISTVSLADNAPTKQAAAVSAEIMAQVDAEIGEFERLATTEVAALDRLALGREVGAASGG